MAEQIAENDNNFVVIYFPVRGYNTSLAYTEQIPLTTPLMYNCRLRDISEQRARGGQRPGLSKAYDTQVSDNLPILELVELITTYVPPE